ncbi:FAD-binding domain-containing protein [Viridothelium virens]|uniref:FAD-binding domain-containing protein n=1 Tax=Viridothelium virens TaxID=1048519 RepID=A0A6A6H6P9_VIRVR|nr:FAD-binding domain-containing protein [Viridothelium virens]
MIAFKLLLHSSLTKSRSPTAWGTPACIYLPTSTNDVAFAIKVLGFTNSPYAIRSGGHSPLAGWANIDDGVLISMSDVTELNYDNITQIATVGYGNRWGDVYEYLQGFGRIVVGGRVPEVGLALTIGGGLSHLTNRFGFSCDNVISFTVVLANASVVSASAQTNSDLFFALKGGTSNFGVVTRMSLKTYPSGKAWGGLVVYNNSYQDQYMSALEAYQKQGQVNDTSTALLTYLAINNQTIFATYVSFGDEVKPSAFQPFYDIPVVEDSTALYDSFIDLANNVQINYAVPRWAWGSTTLYLDEQAYVDLGHISTNESLKVRGIEGGSYVLMPQPISTSMITPSQKTGGNALGLTPRPQMWFSLNIGYELASDDDKVNKIMEESIAELETLTKARGLYDEFIFLNDAAPSQSPIRGYGADNYKKLEAVSQKYDPSGMFQHQVPGGFKIK